MSEKLSINKSEKKESINEKKSAIPSQYRGMPSEVVEELWGNPIYINEEQNKSEIERRQEALEEIKAGEQDRELKKKETWEQRYKNFSEEQRKEFIDAQKDVTSILREHIQGKKNINSLLPEESFVLDKIKASYEYFKKENPDKAFHFDFAKEIDRSVYSNLAQRLSFNALERKRKIKDQERANAICEEAGIPRQDINEESQSSLTEQARAETKELSIEEKSNLSGWEAGFEMAKIAQKQGISLSSLSREDYVQLAIDNNLPIEGDQLRGATWQRSATSMEELMVMRKKKKEELKWSEEDKEFSAFESNIKEIAGKKDAKERYIKNRIKVRSGTHNSSSWLFFGINNGIDDEAKETYKAYISLTDVRKLSPERIVSFMEELRDAGYNGDIKTFQDLAGEGVVLNDQVVMHGRSEGDAKLALQVAENFFENDLNQKSLGKDEVVDGKNTSYSEILASRIKKEIKNRI